MDHWLSPATPVSAASGARPLAEAARRVLARGAAGSGAPSASRRAAAIRRVAATNRRGRSVRGSAPAGVIAPSATPVQPGRRVGQLPTTTTAPTTTRRPATPPGQGRKTTTTTTSGSATGGSNGHGVGVTRRSTAGG